LNSARPVSTWPFRTCFASGFCQVQIVQPDFLQVAVLQLLHVEERVVRTLHGADQLVQLEVHRFRIPVLRVLDEEHHQKRDDRGPGVDHQLPVRAVAEIRPEKPQTITSATTSETHKAACGMSRAPGKPREQ
jgi:hypothetical protein